MRVALAVLALVLALPLHAALSPEQDLRYRALIDQLRCLVCQNQTIAESNAPLAADLRGQVEAQIAAGRSDAEIKAWLTDRYGDFVLYRPPLKRLTLLLWGGPALLLLLALIVALVHARRTRSAKPPPPADAAQVARILSDENP